MNKKEILSIILGVVLIMSSVAIMGCIGGDKKKEDDTPEEETNLDPVSIFTASKSRIVVNENITFDRTGSYDSDGELQSFVWNFGDGFTNSSNSTKLTHNYTRVGHFIVSLTIYDDDAAFNTSSLNITVIPAKVTVGKQQIMLARDNPILPSNITDYFEKESFEANFTFNITIVGGSPTQQFDANFSLEIFDPESVLLVSRQYEVTINPTEDEIILSGIDFTKAGKYRLEMLCGKGGLSLSYTIEIEYM